MDEKTKLVKLSETVYDEASRDAEDIIETALKEKNVLINDAKIKLDAEIKEYIQKETAKIKSENGNAIALYNINSRKELLKIREEYINKIFIKVTEKLKSFVASAGYDQYLNDLCGKALNGLGNVTIIRAASFDVDKIKKYIVAADNDFKDGKIKGGITVEAAKEIKIGGIVAENENRIVDFTFDMRLQNEREKFASTSAFIID